MVRNKRLILGIIGLFILLSPKDSFCAPCYGTRLPQKNGFVIGIQNHTVFRRKLEKDYGKLRSMQNFILLSYGLKDWFSLDLKGGAGYIKQHPLNNAEIDYSTGFAGGYGFRLKLYDQNNKRLVFGFQHISVHPKKSYFDGIKNQAILDDWQGSFLASYDILKITPYLGFKYSRMDYIHKENNQRKRKMSDLTKIFGLVVGLDYNIDQHNWFNLEVQFFDSKTCAFSVNHSF
ncbi:MAG: hypothetical protein NC826_02480 [Candidatus Omnitrophica bacterium]|nr:hypothetical protein [Candidatus Omnitrophota bacterium]